MDVKETAAIMEVLKVAYPRFYADKNTEYIKNAVGLWANMFAEYPAEVVSGAVKAFIANDIKGFPPSIGQIMEKVRLITEPPEMGESEAWVLVRRALNNSAYNSVKEFKKLPKDIQDIVHSPAQLHAWAIDENFNESVESSNFKRAYRTHMERKKEFDALPPEAKKIALQAQGMFKVIE